jgi:hypothetical protein
MPCTVFLSQLQVLRQKQEVEAATPAGGSAKVSLRLKRQKAKQVLLTENLEDITAGIALFAPSMVDVEVAKLCESLANLGIRLEDLSSSGGGAAWAALTSRLLRLAPPRDREVFVLVTILKALDGLQVRWQQLDPGVRDSLVSLLHRVLSAPKGQNSLILRSVVVCLGSLRVQASQLPASTRALVVSSALSLLERPSASSAHVVYALSCMKMTLADHRLDAAQMRRTKMLLALALPTAPASIRWKVISAMAALGLKWRALDINLRLGVEEHVQRFAVVSLRSVQAKEVATVLDGLVRMGATWELLSPATRRSLPLALTSVCKRATPSTLVRLVGSLAALRAQDCGQDLYSLLLARAPAPASGPGSGPASVGSGLASGPGEEQGRGEQATQRRILNTFILRQAAGLGGGDQQHLRDKLARALLDLGANKALVLAARGTGAGSGVDKEKEEREGAGNEPSSTAASPSSSAIVAISPKPSLSAKTSFDDVCLALPGMLENRALGFMLPNSLLMLADAKAIRDAAPASSNDA